MHKFVTLSLTFAAALAAGVAYAQSARGDLTRAEVEQRSAAAFARMDANKDGVLDQADRQARLKAAFDRIDANGDGAIGFDEFSAGKGPRAGSGERRGPRMGSMGRMADADNNSSVTQAEFTAAALARFDRFDADKDGTISGDERRPRRGLRSGREPS